MKAFKKIVHVFLALLLLVATTGVTLNKHYCMGRLKHVAVFHEADSCLAGMGMECPRNCCQDKSQELRVKDLNKTSFTFDVSFDGHLLAAITYLLTGFDLVSFETLTPHYRNYKPPLIELDIPVLVQSFLL